MANVVLCTTIFLLVIINLTGNSSAKSIGYGALDPNHPCDPSHPGSCQSPPANGYNRGCEKEHQCRGPPRGQHRGTEELIGQHRRRPPPPLGHRNDHEAKNGVYNKK